MEIFYRHKGISILSKYSSCLPGKLMPLLAFAHCAAIVKPCVRRPPYALLTAADNAADSRHTTGLTS